MQDLLQKEKLVEDYIKADNRDAAVKLIYELVVHYARAKQFKRAEAFREKLFSVDSMALNEIIKSAEILEAEKNASIDRLHLDVWSDLYKTLTAEEANALFYELKEAVYETGQVIFKQGGRNTRLFFINEGDAKLAYHQGEREALIRMLGPGEFAGEESFFSNTYCTSSLIANSYVKLNFLERDGFAATKVDTPGLESKIHDFCIKRQRRKNQLNKADLDRRKGKRVNVSAKALIQVIKNSGEPLTRPVRGELLDISHSGLSFMLRTSQKSANLLLGRKLSIQFILEQGAAGRKFEKTGNVVAAMSLPFKEYSIHLKFDDSIEEAFIDSLESTDPTGED